MDSLYNATAPSMVRIVACQTAGRQKWRYDIQTMQLQLVENIDACITTGDATAEDGARLARELDGGKSEAQFNVTLSECKSGLSQQQRWILLPLQWKL